MLTRAPRMTGGARVNAYDQNANAYSAGADTDSS